MNFKISNLGIISSPKMVKNNARIAFRGERDIVNFSDITKTRFERAHNLKSIGFSDEEAQEAIKEFYKSEDYDLLVNGEYDEDFKETYPIHNIEKEENLTPTEAILYLYYDMDEYYYQNGCWGPDKELTTISAKNYDLGRNDFSPIELAKYMHQGFDIVLAGMLVKNRLDSDTAEKLKPYYEASMDKFMKSNNLKEAEYTAYVLSQNLEELDYWTSNNKDEEGNFTHGLTRPLTNEEAVIIVKDDYLRHDIKSLNNYIEMNKRFGISLYGMDLKELWDVNPDDIQTRPNNITKAKIKRKVADLAELVDIISKTYPSLSHEVLDDIKMLDNDKFFGRYSYQAIRFDAIMADGDDRELRQKNIQALNKISEELLNKMTSGLKDKKGHFASLNKLFRVSDLDIKIQQLEEYRVNNPMLFNSMTREAIMDYLTDSNFYTRQEEALKMFLDMLSGIDAQDEGQTAEIIEFPFPKD